LCNAVDDPENCDFYYPAIVRRGALQIAISTQGFSPALASRLRRELEAQFGPEWEEWVKEIGNKRREVLSRRGSMAAKRNLLTEAASAEEFRRFVERQRSGNRGESVNKKDERKSKSARPVS
jgi:precorrin-2 dehydrogenase/sirohydrochlorin ferrochelatase